MYNVVNIFMLGERRADRNYLMKNTAFIKRFLQKADGMRSFVIKLFDDSIASGVAVAVRRGFLSLGLRVLGIFFASFGFYSFLIAMLLGFFTERSVDASALYGGAATALCALPLLFSKGSISSSLTDSRTGACVCKYLNIRKETLSKSSPTGTMSIGFVCGVVAGLATLVFPFGSVLFGILFAVTCGVILSSPEAGLTVCVILLFIGDMRIQYVLLAITVASYLFKLIRKKRYIRFEKKDAFVLIFALYSLGAVFITTTDSAVEGCMDFFLLITVYFLCISLLRDREKIARLISAAVITMGFLAALYLIGAAVDALAPMQGLADRDYLIEIVSSLNVFSKSLGDVAMATFIPACVAFIIKPYGDCSRRTMYLCLASMSLCLIIREALAYFAVAFLFTFLLFIMLGSRRIYLTLSAVMAAFTVLLFAGETGDRIYVYIYTRIDRAFSQASGALGYYAESFGERYLFCGHGFAKSSPESSSFFSRLLYDLGLVGLLIFACAAIFVLAWIIQLSAKSRRASLETGVNPRYARAGTGSDIHNASSALFCSLFSLLTVGAFTDFYSDSYCYMFLFLMLGTAFAYGREAKKDIDKFCAPEEWEHTAEFARITIGKGAVNAGSDEK